MKSIINQISNDFESAREKIKGIFQKRKDELETELKDKFIQRSISKEEYEKQMTEIDQSYQRSLNEMLNYATDIEKETTDQFKQIVA